MKTMTKQYDVFFIDDDEGIRRIVHHELERIGCRVRSFSNAAECLEQLPGQKCNLLITDVRMPGMDGLTLLDRVKRVAPWVPVMVITGFGDIPMAVRAVKLGAVDFVEKPLDRTAFLNKVKATLERDTFSNAPTGRALTDIEKTILKLILDGKGNKEIAYRLGRALRTVERHRSDIMRKFDADNVVELVKKAMHLKEQDPDLRDPG